ncbi:MAG: prepilin-type N-terminal cleavage/methylation domain-containing protein, partial [Candidatus Colwellbacteria bacterium]|nr:prepilin-type N-terminal cleavage/methylation domain-containing protein [Candidatus Colwellbacteria bacterium]
MRPRKPRGFTLIELLVVAGIMLILAAIGFSNYAEFKDRKTLEAETNKLVAITREAMERSKSQADGEQWAVHFANPSGSGNDFYEVWKGASYASSTITGKILLESSLKFTDPAENSTKDVIFAKATGLPAASSTIVIETLNGKRRATINIDVTGRVDYSIGSADGEPPPAPPSSPTVTTSIASNVSTSTAALNGSANPNNAVTSGWFRYSTANPGSCNDTFGTRAPASGGVSLGSDDDPVSYSQNISNLTSNTTYYYCAIAQNSAGTGMGGIISLTTTATPPTVTTSVASNVSTSTATLNGSANPNGAATTGWFRYSTADPGSCNDTFGTRSPA